MKPLYAVLIFLFALAPATAQVINGDFATGNLSGWASGGFTDTGNGATNSILSFGASPTFATFLAARNAGFTYTASSGVESIQLNSFDGAAFSATNSPISAPLPSGGNFAYISNFSDQPSAGFNVLSGSFIQQTFLIPQNASLLNLDALFLSNEGLDTAVDQNGDLVGADFGGVALLDQNLNVLHQFTFDAQSNSLANSHVTNFSADNSVSYGGFLCGTNWTDISWDVSQQAGQNLQLIAYSVNTGDTERESRLLVHGVTTGTPLAAVPEPNGLCLLCMGGIFFGCLKFARKLKTALLAIAVLLSSMVPVCQAKADTAPPFVIYAFDGGLKELGWLLQQVLGTRTIATPVSPTPTFSERLDLVQTVPPGPYDGTNWAGNLSGWISMEGYVSDDICHVKVKENYKYEHLGGWPFFISDLSGGCTIRAYVLADEGSTVQMISKRTINTAVGVFTPNTPLEQSFAARVLAETYVYNGHTYHRVGGEYWSGSAAVMPQGDAGWGDTGPTRPPYVGLGIGDVDFTYQVLPIRPVQLQPGDPGDNQPKEHTRCTGMGPVLNLGTGNGLLCYGDPVPTRGWPLSNNIVVNSQVVETGRPMGNATFSYDIHLDWKDVTRRSGAVERHVFVVDGDGTRFDFGSDGTPKTPVGIICDLHPAVNGAYELSMAGVPGHIKTPGYFKYLFDSKGNLIKITDDKGNDQVVNYNGERIANVVDMNTGRRIDFQWDGNRIVRVLENNGGSVTLLSYASGKLTRLEVGNNQAGTTAAAVAYTSQLAYRSDGLLDYIQFDDDPLSRHTFTYQMFIDPQFPEVQVPYASITNPSSARLNVVYGDYSYYSIVGFFTAKTADSYVYSTNAYGDLVGITFPNIFADFGRSLPGYNFEYDADRNMTRVTTENSEWRYVYGPQKQLLQKFDSDGGVWTNTYTIPSPTLTRGYVSPFWCVR